MAIGENYITYVSSTTTTSGWVYTGNDLYDEDGYIKVDKGSPDKAQYVIFYAVDTDPMIFCKNEKELEKELAKLHKREEVDQASIRIFQLIGGVKKLK